MEVVVKIWVKAHKCHVLFKSWAVCLSFSLPLVCHTVICVLDMTWLCVAVMCPILRQAFAL